MGLLQSGTQLLARQATDASSDKNNNIQCDADDTACEFLNLIASPFASELLSDAFLASLAVSLALSLGVLALFCLVRPYNSVVYAPRAKHADTKHAPPPIDKGIFGWIPPLVRTKEQDMVNKVGLDGAIFIRFTKMLRNIFACLTVVGCGILLPVNLVSSNNSAKNASFFLKMTPQYMYGSQAFWAYVAAAYIFDAIIFYFLWRNYKAVVRLRRAYFDSPDFQRSLHARTLLLTDIPKEFRSDEGIVKITEEVHATNDLPRAAVARNVKDLPDLVEEHEETVRALEGHLAKYFKDPNRLPAKRPMCKVSKNDKSYTKGQKVDAIEYLTARIKELEIEIREVRESVDKRNALSYGFASYESINEAHSTAYVARKGGPQGTIIRLAPKPNDLVWKNLKMLKNERNWQNFINNLWVALLTIVWVAPNVLISVFLSNLTHLGLLWPAFNDNLMANQKWWSVFQGVAAPAITTAFYYYLPHIFRQLCINSGDVTKTSRERHVMHKLYSFFVINNLIVFSLFSAVFGFITAAVNASKTDSAWDAIVDSEPFVKIVSTLCQVSPYWVSWLLQRNLGAAIDLSQLTNLAWGSFSRRFLSPTPRQLIELSAPQPFDYASYYNYFLFYSTVAFCYAGLQPLALPVTAFYFWIDSWIKKYLLLYVFITKYESGGMFWRTLFNRVLVFTVLGNIVIALLVGAQAVGVYEGNVANWGMLVAMVPLPFLIAGFKWYCARTFDDEIHYYQMGKAMKDAEWHAGNEQKRRKGDRVGVRFGHPVLYKPLMTPMVSAKAQHLLKQVYSGRTSLDDNGTVAGFSDVYMDAMDTNRPGKPSGMAPFEVVPEHEMDFEHYKNRPEFRDELGGDGELYGQAQDIIRPGTPGTMTTMSRTGTMETFDSRGRRSGSRGPLAGRGRSDSRDSEQAAVNAPTEYPRGYHHTPNLRDASPAGSDYSVDDTNRGRFLDIGSHKTSQEGLVSNAARMGGSPPPTLPTPRAPSPGGYSAIYGGGRGGSNASTPAGDAEEDTSYDYFRRGRNL
ncbi:DUF221 family protein [Hortaea werneckii]|nr:DUF221 family protein [Hortaea werneckii]